MPLTVVQIPLASVVVDEARFPDRDQSMIIEHLIRYFSKFENLPAISISIHQGRATLVRGHKYYQAARVLGRSTIRAVVEGSPSLEELTFLMTQTGATALDWETIKAAEALEPMPKGWLVFFFARPLTTEEKAAFNMAAKALYSHDEIQVFHDDAGPVAEFEARVPVNDELFFRKHLDTFATFHNEHVPIVSFQGGRFGR